MSILNTGRQQLAQADALNKQSTDLRNDLAANNAGLEMAERSNKQSMRGQAMGSMASMAIAHGGQKLLEWGLRMPRQLVKVWRTRREPGQRQRAQEQQQVLVLPQAQARRPGQARQRPEQQPQKRPGHLPRLLHRQRLPLRLHQRRPALALLARRLAGRQLLPQSPMSDGQRQSAHWLTAYLVKEGAQHRKT